MAAAAIMIMIKVRLLLSSPVLGELPNGRYDEDVPVLLPEPLPEPLPEESDPPE
jgi:hypothetical protein